MSRDIIDNKSTELIFSSDLILVNSRNKRPYEYLLEMGYGESKLLEGDQLRDELERVMNVLFDKKADKLKSTKLFNQIKAEATATYNRFVEIARIAFRDDLETTIALELKGRRSSGFSNWCSGARQFYEGMDKKRVAKMAKYGCSKKTLAAGLALVEKAIKADIDKVKKHADAQASTKEKDRAYKKFARWISDFKRIAKLAFVEKPQLMESLGIVVKR